MPNRPRCVSRRPLAPCPDGRFPLTLLLLGVAACSGNDPSGSEAGAGEAHVLPSDAVQLLGTSDALTWVRDLEVASDGTIWVLDEHPPFFVGFQADGEVIAELGHRGEGPMEFGHPVSLLAAGGGDPGTSGIWAFDRLRHSLVRVREADVLFPSEVEGTSVPLPQGVVRPGSLLARTGGIPGMYPWMAAAGNSAFAAHSGGGASRGTGYWTARVVEIPLESGEPIERWRMEELLPSPEAHYPGATEFLPFPLWAVCPDGEAWMYDPARHRVRSLHAPERTDHALPPARNVTFSLDRLLDLLLPSIVAQVPTSERPPDDVLREQLAGEVDQMIDQFAAVFPEYFQMLCAPDGTLWLQHFDWEEGFAGAGWSWERLRVGEGDSGAESIRLPAGFQAFRITSDRAWGIVMDELGIPSVAWIELP
ncbi:MAG: hypothetical protein EA350_03720 [Gemmatimonadales bacterium]|nr:MAG: hypothetical protein EA350_03720 [Gemmatimonadales bacterium]